MEGRALKGEIQELDETSWVYLSLWEEEGAEGDLHQKVVEACAASGWPAVSWSPPVQQGNVTDSARFFEGMSHAVEHADAVVVLVGARSAMTDAELAFAYRHKRPVIALRIGEPQADASTVQAMLQGYGRARLVECESIEECEEGLRQALADPWFAAAVEQASEEQSSHG